MTRLEGFSDAVFGFALTLLVVSLEVPKTFAELTATMRGFVAFAFCFAIVVWIWHEHYLFFRRYGLQDGLTVVLNAVLLFVVLFYVYPLKFLFTVLVAEVFHLGAGEKAIEIGQVPTLMTVYGAGFIVLFLVFAALYAHAASRRAGLVLSPLETLDARLWCGSHLLTAAVGLVSIALAATLKLRYIGFSGWSYALLGPILGAYGAWAEKRRKALAASVPRDDRAPD
ncbi:MAG TPA: TMEM175 family protein [Thermoanaerobaculia bacterium]